MGQSSHGARATTRLDSANSHNGQFFKLSVLILEFDLIFGASTRGKS
ncbi:MAG: hypothetical protein WBF71_15255 [Microthrixaceae bacterium]|jgi:hypothetical protein